MPKKRKKRRFATPSQKKGMRRSWWIKRLLLLAIVGIVGVAGFITWCAYTLPPIESIYGKPKRPSIVFLAADNQELATYGDIYGETVTIQDVPKNLINAILATEDRHFFEHSGIQWTGMIRAMLVNIRHGRVAQGGSTITQQLVKNLFLTPKKSITRKVQEMLLSFWLERNFNKEQILNLYLNKVYMGGGTYGVDAAAQRYFGKLSAYLALPEAAVIAGLLQAPSAHGSSKERMKERARTVLDRMLGANFITAKQHKDAISRLKNLVFSQTSGDQSTRYFTDWLMTQLPNLVDVSEDILVRTTLDLDAQKTASSTLRNFLETTPKEKNVSEAACVVTDRNGAIKVLLGGKNYQEKQYNHATQAWRQPGSSFKVAIFLAALREGFSSSTIVSDLPYHNRGWSPGNFHWTSKGDITFHEALVHSVNTSAIRVAEMAGMKAIIRTARDLGFDGILPDNLTIALGTGQVTLVQLVRMMGIVSNQGQFFAPYGIVDIRTTDGNILYQRQQSTEPPAQLIDPDVIADLDGMLRGVVLEGTGKAANIPDYRVAGKTGTTQDYRDAWFIGYTPDLVAGVWMGNSNNQPMNKVPGSTLPAVLWRKIIEQARPKEPEPTEQTLEIG
jgi:penicillin-binding protein 1A